VYLEDLEKSFRNNLETAEVIVSDKFAFSKIVPFTG
jgi:hypothetical protein